MEEKYDGPAEAEVTAAERTQLETHRDNLYSRLESGYERIERGLASGEDVTTWEDFFTALLREYERVCIELQRDLAV